MFLNQVGQTDQSECSDDSEQSDWEPKVLPGFSLIADIYGDWCRNHSTIDKSFPLPIILVVDKGEITKDHRLVNNERNQDWSIWAVNDISSGSSPSAELGKTRLTKDSVHEMHETYY